MSRRAVMLVVTRTSALASVVVACAGAAPPPARPESGVCDPPFHGAGTDLQSIAFLAPNGRSMWSLFGEPIESARSYAVVDDSGYVGTLQARDILPCTVGCVECCGNPEWDVRWIADGRATRGIALAFGPVNGRYASARRSTPLASTDPSASSWAWMRADGEAWKTVARIDFDGEPSAIEARKRQCAGAAISEVRVEERGAWSLSSRKVDEVKDHGRTLD